MSKIDIKVRELIDKVEHKELILPEMQRRYVWTATRVRDLLDSLYRGYPSGTILVWETDEEIKTRDLSIESEGNPTISSKQLLLDGQQRITSLFAVLNGKPVNVRNRKRPIDILFNLDHPEGPPVEITEVDDNDFTADLEDIEDEETVERDIQAEMKRRTFVVASRSLQRDPLWVPVSDIFKKDHGEILQRAGITSFQDPNYKKYSSRLQKVKDIEKYQYVMEVLGKSMSYEEVTEIFVRVNSLGIKLRGSDLALAQITSKWKGFMNIIEDFSMRFKSNKDYILETGLPVRSLVIFATHQSKFKTVGKISKKKLEESWNLAKNGLQFAVDFLRKNAGIENLNHLSSPFLLLPIAAYFVLNNESLSEEDERKLLKWFYFAHMRGHYSMGSSESILDADLSIIFKERDLDKLVTQLHLHVKKFDVDYNDLIGKSIRSPFFSMLYFILKQKEARDWWSGLKLSDEHIGKAHKIQFHHIFPKSLLRDKYEKKEINEIANMAFIGGKTNRRILNKEPREYLEKEVITKRGEEALVSQLITLDRNLWEIDSYREFLDLRRKAIANEINKFMKKFEIE